ncbi:MAG TPA: helix-turn-helix domain-containing protein [Trueperaceae bacterium]
MARRDPSDLASGSNGLGTSDREAGRSVVPSKAVAGAAVGVRGRNGARNLRECAAGEGIEVLQEKWVLHIVHALLDGPKGFNELGRLVGGCNPTTLTQRLARLEDLGVLHKESGPVGGRCSYSLTEAGLGLERVITAIRSWASAHLRDA